MQETLRYKDVFKRQRKDAGIVYNYVTTDQPWQKYAFVCKNQKFTLFSLNYTVMYFKLYIICYYDVPSWSCVLLKFSSVRKCN